VDADAIGQRRYYLECCEKRRMKILAISDIVEPVLYGPNISSYAADVEAIISCGDLPFEYLEYVLTFSGAPLYYVLGNHDPAEERKAPAGCIPLDGRGVRVGDLTLAGLSGSRLYSGGPNQYAEHAMRRRCRALSRKIIFGSLWGRELPDVFVTHAPPFGLGDAEDPAHIGFEAFLPLIDRYAPALWLHGHIHLYGPGIEERRVAGRGVTQVVNVYGHKFLEAPAKAVAGTVPGHASGLQAT
jgi:Icc-related predicted phosphoesterase